MRARWIAVLAVAGGCLDVPVAPASQCTSTADCNISAGEVCEAGVCWGNPPEGMFAGTISPPSERGDLVPLELGAIELPPDGWMGDLSLEAPVVFSGRVEAFCVPPMDCGARTSLEATITITRPSQFHGGPGFRTVVTSQPDVVTGTSFRVALPRTRPGETPYTITIVPAGAYARAGLVTAAALVPPLRAELELANNATGGGKIFQLGEGVLDVLEGKVMDANGDGLAGYRVVALGRWDTNAPAGEISTVAQTDQDGRYLLKLSAGVVGQVEIVAAPIADPTGAVLHIANVDPKAAIARNLTKPVYLGYKTSIPIVVKGGTSSGRIAPLAGARVRLSAIASVMSSGVYVTASSEVTTGDDGVAIVEAYDGEVFGGAYRLRIVPPAGSSAAAMFDKAVVLDELRSSETTLGNRVALTGIARDTRGEPLGGVAVTVHPALRFTWSLADLPQGFLSEIPAATTVTTTAGEFVVFVDPIVAETWGSYDLVFEPTLESRAGNWIVSDIALPRDSDTTSVMLNPITIPDAAFVHGRILDPDGLVLEDAELKLFRVLSPDAQLCAEVNHAPASCPIPATLQGRGESDVNGVVRLTLPRP